jgi:flagellar basal body-associated protein FliL
MGILGIISRVLIIIVLIATSLLSIGTAYIMFAPDALPKPFRLLYDFNPPTAAETTPEVVEVEVEPGKGIIVAAGTKIINLNGTNGNKYIRVTVSLEFNPTNPAYSTMTAEAKATYLTEFNTEIASKMAIIDDTIITCIALKTFDQLYTAEGKESLRRELMEKLHARIEEPKIIALYFTEFVIN